LGEFIAPTNDAPSASDFDSDGNLKVFIPSASFGPVPIVGVSGTLVLTQEVVLRSITAGGSGTFNLSLQNNRNLDHSGFVVETVSAQGVPITSVTLQAGQVSFYVRVTADGTFFNVDPTECQWYVTATHSVTGQK